MPVCRKCNEKFPNYVVIDDKKRSLCNRKYCLKCSAYGKHNTRILDIQTKIKKNKILYNTEDGSKVCSKCNHVFITKGSMCWSCTAIRSKQNKKIKYIKYKGGKCNICGYNTCVRSLDFHHINIEEKEFSLSQTSNNWEKVRQELDKCNLLCKNCHHEIHYDLYINKYNYNGNIDRDKHESICSICGKNYSHKHSGYTKTKCNSCRIRIIREKTKAWAVQYKGGKCELCGYTKCIQSLAFHHVFSYEKEFTISNSYCYSRNRLKTEIDKCILVCQNCHGEIHAKLYSNILA